MSGQIDTQSLIASMGDVVGQSYLLTDTEKKQPYTKGTPSFKKNPGHLSGTHWLVQLP